MHLLKKDLKETILMKKMAKKMEQVWSKGFMMFSATMMVLLIGGMLVTTLIQTGIQEWIAYNSEENQNIRNLTTNLTMSETSVTIKNFDGVSEEAFDRKVNELTPAQLSYVFRSGYTIYVIKNYDHLGSEAALKAQANGDSVFVEESNKTIWCHELASKEEFSQLIDQFIEDQRLRLQKQ